MGNEKLIVLIFKSNLLKTVNNRIKQMNNIWYFYVTFFLTYICTKLNHYNKLIFRLKLTYFITYYL